MFSEDKDNLLDDSELGNIVHVDDGEESKKDTTHPNCQRYYLFRYFKSLPEDELSKILVADSGVDPMDAKLKLNDSSLSIQT